MNGLIDREIRKEGLYVYHMHNSLMWFPGQNKRIAHVLQKLFTYD
jgi:hypothetical protein